MTSVASKRITSISCVFGRVFLFFFYELKKIIEKYTLNLYTYTVLHKIIIVKKKSKKRELQVYFSNR